jgi:hypothetical protein
VTQLLACLRHVFRDQRLNLFRAEGRSGEALARVLAELWVERMRQR